MRVLFLTASLSVENGWGRYSVELITHLKEIGVDPVILTRRGASAIPEALRGSVFPVLPSYSAHGAGHVLSESLKLRKYAAVCDLVHILTEPYLPLTVLISRKKPIIMTAHGTHAVRPLHNPRYGVIYRFLYRRLAKIVCISSFTMKMLKSKMPASSLLCILSGVNSFQFAHEAKSKDSSAMKHIISVGALKPRKGYHVALEAVARVRTKFRGLHYTIVGSVDNKEYARDLLKLVARSNIADVVEFKERVSDSELAELYQSADVFLLTPVTVGLSFEGFGLVYLEAGSARLPVIGTRDTGAEEAIIDEKTGLLVSQKDSVETANALMRILTDPEFALRLGAAGHEWARSHSWMRTAEQYRTLYNSIVKQKNIS